MKTIPLQSLEQQPQQYKDIAKVLDSGGLVCAPCGGEYRILADLGNVKAVQRLFQSKGRTSKAPSLVFVENTAMLRQVVAEVTPLSEKLASALWPGPLTILFSAGEQLPTKVVKQLVGANGRIGVRIPDSAVVRRLLGEFGRPLLVSSANKQKKKGAGSPAQVRKNFVSRVDLFLDDGDLQQKPASTVVLIDGDQLEVTRVGAVDEEQVRAAVA